MNKTLVVAEWKRGAESLGAALSCRRDGFHADAVSRCYYAVLHAARAALQTVGIVAENHAAVKRSFGLHLVLSGLVEAEWGSSIGESLDLRLTADYDVVTRISESESKEECDRAEMFLGRILVFLVSQGIPEEELRAEAKK